MTAEAWGEHVPSRVMPLGVRVLENEEGESPLDVYARYDDDYDAGGALVVLYQGGDVIALDAAQWDAVAARVRSVILNGMADD